MAKYGGAVVALTLDEAGIPPTAEGRLRRNGQRRGRKYREQVVKVQKDIMGAENPLSLFLI